MPNLPTIRNAMLVTGTFFLGACGGSNSDNNIQTAPPPVVQGLLTAAGSSDNFVASLKTSFTEAIVNEPSQDMFQRFAVSVPLELAGPASPVAAPPTLADSSAGGGFTTTYTVDADVDEFDVVKYDGERMFIAPRIGCCALSVPFTTDTASIVQPASGEDAIRVLTSDPDSATVTEAARIDLTAGMSVQGMYLAGDTLATLTSVNYYGGWGSSWFGFGSWVSQQHGLQLYDVTNSDAPELIFDASFDGGFIDSRRVGDKLMLVSRYTPTIDELNYFPDSEEARNQNAQLLSAVELNDLLPTVRINGEERQLVDPASCLITNDSPDAAGRSDNPANSTQATRTPPPVLTVITSVDINNPTELESVCYSEQAYGVYASSNAIYLMQLRFGSDAGTEQTRIHKFDLASLSYRGSAEVDGLLWSGGQLDFRSNEHNGVLRVMTTKSTSDPADVVDHQLYTLREAADRPELEILATLPSAESPAEIGKPNESLYGVRFFGDRAYAVTFEQIDPLYVLDLKDPAAPRLAGELEVTGFSDFLHPVSNNLLLGFGRSDTQALKLELFDVSDISTPKSLAVETLGGPWSTSEALYDRHAFTYQANVVRGNVTVDRFAVPADLLDEATFDWQQSGLYLYEIGNVETPASASLTAAGSLVIESRTDEQRWPSGSRYRAIFDNDTVYVIRNEDVFGAYWNDPTNVLGPQ